MLIKVTEVVMAVVVILVVVVVVAIAVVGNSSGHSSVANTEYCYKYCMNTAGGNSIGC